MRVTARESASSTVSASACIAAQCAAIVKLLVYFRLVFTARRVCIAQTMPWQDVRLSHAGILSKRLYISSKFLHNRAAPPSALVFQYQTGWQNSDGDPLTGPSNARGYEKITIFDNISLYLGNDARQRHSYYGRRTGNRSQAFKRQFE